MLISMSMDTGVTAKSRWDGDCSQETTPAAWNPVMAGLQEAGAEMPRQRAMPAGMLNVDVDAFLREMVAIRR